MTRRMTTNSDQAIYIISVAAELAGVHPQTLRVYERKGLLRPQRTSGNTRRYSQQDIERLRRIQELTQEGVNLAGVVRIMELERELARMQRKLEDLAGQLADARAVIDEADDARNHVALVPIKDVRRIRRAMKSDVIEKAGRRRTFPAPPIA